MQTEKVAEHGPAQRRAPGRPRNPNTEAQALRAAFELFAERGWAGFSYGAVAHRAGIGKDALYLRWQSRAALVLASIEAQQASLGEIDTGDVREDLMELARHMFRFLSSEHGTVALRLHAEARVFPELQAGLEGRAYSQPVRNARQIVRRAIDRGQLSANASPTLVTDLVAGAVLNHVLATPPRLREAAEAHADDYFAQLVDAVIAGAAAAGSPGRNANPRDEHAGRTDERQRRPRRDVGAKHSRA